MTVITLPGVKLPERPNELSYIEPVPPPEFFCADLARVHVHGPFTRLIWTTVEIPAFEGDPTPQNSAVCKIVVPTEALPAIYEAIGKRLQSPASPAE